MGWLQQLLNSPDKRIRALAASCPVCWAPARQRCYRQVNGRWDRSRRRALPHPERYQRVQRRTGLR